MAKPYLPEHCMNMGVRLDPTQYQKLQALSRAAGKPASAVIRDLIEGAEVITTPRYRMRTETTAPARVGEEDADDPSGPTQLKLW
jgi:predicted DNA-binding protein